MCLPRRSDRGGGLTVACQIGRRATREGWWLLQSLRDLDGDGRQGTLDAERGAGLPVFVLRVPLVSEMRWTASASIPWSLRMRFSAWSLLRQVASRSGCIHRERHAMRVFATGHSFASLCASACRIHIGVQAPTPIRPSLLYSASKPCESQMSSCALSSRGRFFSLKMPTALPAGRGG